MAEKKKKLFCEINPFTYMLSERKNIAVRHIKNITSGNKFAKEISEEEFPCIVSSVSSHLIKKGKDIDPETQYNKAENIRIACKSLNRLVIYPGETFSFWKRLGNATKRKGYKEGRVIRFGKLTTGLGGGLCNLANSIHRAVLNSPLDDTEFNMHSDALAPDENGVRVPMSAGTSVKYNYRDYCFKNNTDRPVQLIARCDEDSLYCEIRSREEFPELYRISEEGHHFTKEGDRYFRVSKIYKDTVSRETGEVLKHELILDNHSEVLFDPSLIPKELIK